MRRSHMVALAAAVLVALVAWWLLRGGGGGDGDGDRDGRAGMDQQASDRTRSGEAPPRLPGAAAGGEGAAAGEGAAGARKLAPGTRAADPALAYPEDSRPLSPADRRFLEPDRPAAERRPVMPGPGAGRGAASGLEVIFTADRRGITGREALTTTLAVFREGEGGPLPVDVLAAEVLTAPARAAPARRLSRLDLRDDGGGGDETAGDRIHTGVLFPQGAGLRSSGPHVVRVRFRAEAVEGEASLPFHYTAERDIPARFAGPVTDRIEHGSLIVEVGVEVARAGTYVIDANLHGAAGPLARATARAELGRGAGRVPLRFYGMILRESGADGPYRLGELRGYRFAPGERPDRQMMPRWTGEHETAPYRASDFTDRPWSAGR